MKFAAVYPDWEWLSTSVFRRAELTQGASGDVLCSRMVAIGALCYGLIDSGTLADTTQCLPVRGAAQGPLWTETLLVIGIHGFPAKFPFQALGRGLLHQGVFGIVAQ
jgi:hypothetical protein